MDAFRGPTGWTGGQYSLIRALFGTWLVAHFVWLLLGGGTALESAALSAGALAAVLFALGAYDRIAAPVAWLVWAPYLLGDPLSEGVSLRLASWLLVVHMFVPPAPYGSWAARARPDPDDGWSLPGTVWAASWGLVLLAVAHDAPGPLASPLWLLAAPLALLARARPWLWLLLVGVLGTGVLWGGGIAGGFAAAFLLLHAFDPAWIPARASREPALLFYDGACGLCHRTVRFVLAEDPDGAAFCFAPLESEAFRGRFSEEERRELPDSVIVASPEGDPLTRSTAILEVGDRLGGLWRTLAALVGLVPPALRDRLYDGIAGVRSRLFARPAQACPILPPHLRERFSR